ncbi:hypothetical protein HPC49_31745 [Pyxidicoccus fallax]|uniref:Uncharacterized protein n=1 Tax=Pyxidicoccus fallax TaxID=394095 RepID=A0A848LNS9_9BACT|nr:hypothetical protein [Pyxidicoccus fallax]NMO19525.1 hypothetical protein [Pyxidicoccus fallax]NPC82784.1 hypothetical protein [Pyxidicoccus fallax]
MALACREYVTPHRAGTKKDDYERLLAIKDALGPIMARSKSLRFKAKALYQVKDLENELLNPKAILAASGGVLPVIWLNVTWQPGDLPAEDLRPLEQQFNLKLLGEFVDENAV